MAVTTAITNAEKLSQLTALAGHNLKIALYTQAAANLNKDTTVYRMALNRRRSSRPFQSKFLMPTNPQPARI